MSEVVAVTPAVDPNRSATLVALDAEAPRLEDLFTFMVDAELRVQSVRMRLEERVGTARGEELSTIELILRHPGRARITTRHSTDPLSRDYRVWASDGQVVTTYDALDERASVRPIRPMPVGAADPSKPRFAQVWTPRTQLPVSSVVGRAARTDSLWRRVLPDTGNANGAFNYAVMFGDESWPHWGGYTLGYKIVRSAAEKEKISPREWVKWSGTEMLKKSCYK